MAEGDAHVQVLLPYALRDYAGGRETVEIAATNLAEAIRLRDRDVVTILPSVAGG